MMTDQVSLSCTLMHYQGASERRISLERIIQRLQPQKIVDHWRDFCVMSDMYKRGPWWNAKRCWEHAATQQTTHHLLLQDDIEVCKDFVTGVFDVIKVFPNDVLSLFHGPRKNFDGSCRWGITNTGPWGQAIVMPTPLISKFLIWQDAHVDKRLKHDDSRLALFLYKTKRRTMVPFPNLIDHCQLKSVVGNSWSQPRVSSNFLADRSPHDFDWSDTGRYMKSNNSLSQYNKFLINL